MQTEGSVSAHAAETIGFYELWRVLAARKGWILASFIVTVVAALGYIVWTTPVYEARATFRIGQVGGSGLLEAPANVASRLQASFGENVADGVKRERPFLKRAVALSSVPGAVELVAEGYSPEDAAGLLTRIYSLVDAAHSSLYRDIHTVLDAQIRNIDLRKGELQEQYNATTAIIDSLRRTGDTVQASIFVLERGRIATSMAELDAEKPKAALRLAPPQTQPTALLREVVPPSRPSAPRKTLVVAIAAFVGLLAGIAFALIAEFIASANARR